MNKSFLCYACDVLADTNTGLSGTEIIKYCGRYAVDYNVMIPVDDIEMLKTTYKPMVPNKRTALLRNLEAFSKEQQIKIVKELCELPKFKNNEDVKQLLVKMNQRYPQSPNDEIDQKQIKETINLLEKYSNSFKLYKEALEKYQKGIYQRNVLDDMRLALELLVKELLHNNKSLEKQRSDIGIALKNSKTSNEINNLFVKVIDYYSKYQNNYIKHNDLVNANEIDYIIGQTNLMMLFLIRNLE